MGGLHIGDGSHPVTGCPHENRCVPIREVSLLERCPHFRGVPIREVSSFQRVLCTGFNGVGT